jgi:hypothetical protein
LGSPVTTGGEPSHAALVLMHSVADAGFAADSRVGGGTAKPICKQKQERSHADANGVYLVRSKN